MLTYLCVFTNVDRGINSVYQDLSRKPRPCSKLLVNKKTVIAEFCDIKIIVIALHILSRQKFAVAMQTKFGGAYARQDY